MLMNINKSLYGLVQAPLYWYNPLRGYFNARGFKPTHMDPCMFSGRVMISLIYIDDVIFFGPDQNNIDEVIK